MEWAYTDIRFQKREDITVSDLVDKINMEVDIIKHYQSEVYMRKICDNKAQMITAVKNPVVFPTDYIFSDICNTIEKDVEQLEKAIAAYPPEEEPPRNLRSTCMNAKDAVKSFSKSMDLIEKFYRV